MIRFRPVQEDLIDEAARAACEEILRTKAGLLDELAAAFLKRTNLPPEEVALIEQRDLAQTKWWFARRDDPLKAVLRDLISYTEQLELLVYDNSEAKIDHAIMARAKVALDGP